MNELVQKASERLRLLHEIYDALVEQYDKLANEFLIQSSLFITKELIAMAISDASDFIERNKR